MRPEIKKYRDLLTKLEEEQHDKDNQRKARVQQYKFDFEIKGV